MRFKLGYYYHSRKTGKAWTFLGTDDHGMLHFSHNVPSNMATARLFASEAEEVFKDAIGYIDKGFSETPYMNINACPNV